MAYTNDVVEVSPYDVRTLKNKYERARMDDQQSFYFKGREISTSYAKYLLECLDLKTSESIKVLVGVVPLET